ncbi:hypothetical protein BC831DRAFT_390881, partial [Entophlyctis helioformis]
VAGNESRVRGMSLTGYSTWMASFMSRKMDGGWEAINAKALRAMSGDLNVRYAEARRSLERCKILARLTSPIGAKTASSSGWMTRC